MCEEFRVLTAEEIIRYLKLEPLQVEGGYFREIYRSTLKVSASDLPSVYEGARNLATSIYYLLTPGEFSAIHRLPSDEIFHFYLGDPVQMLQLYPDGKGEVIMIGNDLAQNMSPQVLAPGGTWQGTRLASGGRLALMGTTVFPGFDYRDFTLGSREELGRLYPDFIKWIIKLTA